LELNVEIHELGIKALEYSSELKRVLGEVSRVVVGQRGVLERLVIALLADGHVLLEGMPGLAKTLMVKSLAATIDASFRRIQFTPDLLPADIIGTEIYNQHTGGFTTKQGPVFAHLILADEINRAPPKVQSALLEAMQERQVTIAEKTYPLPRPFLVMATQNPVESQGTYELPEAQVDRFMFKILVDYPPREDEEEIIKRMTSGEEPGVNRVITTGRIREMQDFNRKIYLDSRIVRYITSIVQATRKPGDFGLDFENFIDFGASPRASIWLALASRAKALLEGRGYVTPEDVKFTAHDVLRHRLILSYEALAEEVTADQLIDSILTAVPVP